MTIAIARVQPVHLMNAEHHVSAGPQTKSTNLVHESAGRMLPSTSTIPFIITEPES